MSFKYLDKYDQLNRFAQENSSVGSAAKGAGATSRQRTKKMLALGEAQAADTVNKMRSSARGIRKIFDQSDISASRKERLGPDLESAAMMQAIQEDFEENRREEKPKTSPFAGGEEKSPDGSTSFLDFDEGMLEYARDAVSDVESRGRGGYSAIGPVVKTGMYKGQRAYGKYQVMEGNIGPWTEKHYGKRLTAKEFLANTEAQDAVVENELMGNWRKHGTIEDAVSIWFSGSPIAQAGKASDGYLTVPEYLKKFRNNYIRRFNEDLGEQ